MENRSGDDRPIGVFDSGVGGLTVVSALRERLPQERICYFGDTARCPYGDRDPHEVQMYAREVLDFLLEQNVKLFVVACNTATATALPLLQARYSIPVLGVIAPGARAALRETQSGRIGVIGTAVTVASDAYRLAVKMLSPDVEVFSAACPGFVPLVEQGLVAGAAVESVISDSLSGLLQYGIDTLILGCTHYPLLAQSISTVVGSSVRLISSADETAREVETTLRQMNALHTQEPKGVRAPDRFYTSGDGSRMRRALQMWLGESFDAVDVQTVPVHSLATAQGG